MMFTIKRIPGFIRSYGIYNDSGNLAIKRKFRTFKRAKYAADLLEEIANETSQALRELLNKESDGAGN